MSRLPIPGSDTEKWGEILNDFLRVAHREDGSLRGVGPGFDVVDFGARADGRDDSGAFQGAVNAAAGAGGGVVLVPPGLYRVKAPIEIPGNAWIRILGTGPHGARIRFEPESGRAQFNIGLGVGLGSELELMGLTLDTAAKAGSTDLFHPVLVRQDSRAASEGLSRTRVRVSGCRFTGSSPAVAIKLEGGPHVLEVERCVFEMFAEVPRISMAVLAVDIAGAESGTVHVRHCRFSTSAHCLYLSGGTSVLLEDTVFVRSGNAEAGLQYGVHFFGGVGIQPRFCTIRRCRFEDGVAHQLLTNARIRTVVEDCTFVGRPGFECVRVRDGGVELRRCVFDGDPNSQISDSLEPTSGGVFAEDCEFSGSPLVANVRRFHGGASEWRFVRCRFRNFNDASSSYGILMEKFGEIVCVDCTFERSSLANRECHYMRVMTGRLVMRGCTVRGERSLWITAEAGDVNVELWDNVFASADLHGVRFEQWQSEHSTFVKGGGNRFEGPAVGPAVNGFGRKRIQGSLGMPAGFGTAVVAASELELSPNANTFRVTGETAVRSIRFSGEGASERVFYGPLRLVVDSVAGWRLEASGNIRPSHTNSRALHEVVTLVFDPAADDEAGVWYEV